MYNLNEKAIIWLSLFEKLSNTKQKALLSLFEEPKQIFTSLLTHKAQIQKVVGEDIYYKMLATDSTLLESYIDNLNSAKIICLTYLSKYYPEKLKSFKDSPSILFAKGDVSLLVNPAVAIVGTRTPTAYGRETTTLFSEKLAKNGFVIVSGLASGVDKFAHEGALKVGGKTIAVLGGGFNNIYPAMNTNLAKTIAERGLLISEYRPSLSATKYTFPVRNRIIAGLSDAVLLTEAGEKSGALYTKEFAKDQSKPVFAVPANINNSRAVGTNKLIKNHEAFMAISPEDIINYFGILPQEDVKEEKHIQISVTEKLILDALEDKNQTFDELQSITKLESKNLNSCLTMLQIRGLIKKLPGNEYSL